MEAGREPMRWRAVSFIQSAGPLKRYTGFSPNRMLPNRVGKSAPLGGRYTAPCVSVYVRPASVVNPSA